MYNNTEVSIFTVPYTQGDSGDIISGTPLFAKKILADVQPYTGELAYKEYGISKNINKRMFCDPDPYLVERNEIHIGSSKYVIVYIAPWEDQYECLLEVL